MKPQVSHLTTLLTLLFSLLTTGGCSDIFLPPEQSEGETLRNRYYIIDRVQQPRTDLGVTPVDEEWSVGKTIPLYRRLYAPLSRNGLAVIDGTREVEVVDLRTGRIAARLAGLNGEEIAPFSAAISPDGKRVGFSVISPEGDSSRRHLHLVDLDGSNRTVVDVGPGWNQFLRFSPDGEHIAFFAGGEEQDFRGITATEHPGTLYIVSSSDGTMELITETADLATHFPVQWSPDGSRILFRDAYNNGLLWMAEMSNGYARLVYSGECHAEWSPDGEELAVTNRNGLYLYDINQLGAPRIITSDPVLFPHWDHSGRSIVGYRIVGDFETFNVDRDQTELVRVDLTTDEISVLASNRDTWYIFDTRDFD